MNTIYEYKDIDTFTRLEDGTLFLAKPLNAYRLWRRIRASRQVLMGRAVPVRRK